MAKDSKTPFSNYKLAALQTELCTARQIERWAFYFAVEAVAAVNVLWRATMPELGSSNVIFGV